MARDIVPMPIPFPLVPGHEIAGVVSKVRVIITMDMIDETTWLQGCQMTIGKFLDNRHLALRA